MEEARKIRTPQKGVTIYPAWCKKCGLCAAFCPKGVFGRDSSGAPVVLHPEKCIACHQCELRCPDFAISVSSGEEEAGNEA